jgi:hypothetical protein
MSYGVMAYAVRQSLWTAVGSGDPALLEAVSHGRRADRQAETLDELLQDTVREGEALPDARRALRQLLLGEPLDERIGFVYAYWLEHLCTYELLLPNGAWMPIPVPWLDTVEQGLARAGVKGVSVSSIIMGGLPIKLPPIADFPLMGCTSRQQAQVLLQAFGTCDLSSEPDQQVRGSMLELREWLSICTTHGTDLVCFYH